MLRRARLYNVCQHEDRLLETGPGLTIVVGPQGAGKTNLLTMALSSVTGSNELKGTKKENIREGCEKQPSFVSTEWDFGGKRVGLTRSLNAKTKSNISIDGEVIPELRREGEITAKMLEVAGTTKDDLFRFSFVAQGDTDDILTKLPADRVRFMSSLLGMSSVLEWSSPTDKAHAVVRASLRIDYRERIREARLDWVTARQARMNAAGDLERFRVTYEKVKEEYAQLELESEIFRGLQRATAEFETIQASVGTHQAELERLNQGIPKSQSKRQELAGVITAVEKLVGIHEDNENRSSAELSLESHEKIIGDLERKLSAKPVEPTVQRYTEEAYLSARSQYIELRRNLNLAEEGVAECSKCGSPIDISKGRVSKLRSDMETLKQRGVDIANSRDDWLSYEKRKSVYDTNAEHWRESLATSRGAVESLEIDLIMIPERQAVPAWFAKNPDRLEKDKQNLHDHELTVTRMETTAGIKSSKLKELQEELATKEAEVVRKRAELGDFSQERYKQLKTAMQTAPDGLLEYEKSYQVASMASDNAKAAVAQLATSARRQRKVIFAEKALAELSEHLKTKELPRDIVYERLRGLGVRMSALCSELNQPYSVQVAEDLDFQVQHTSGRVESAQRLSGGQRACVSTIFWLVRLMSNIGNNLPILVLDEPSANMDPNGVVGQFGEMLKRLNPILVQNNLQVFVVTHHRQLIGAGQYVCDLGA